MPQRQHRFGFARTLRVCHAALRLCLVYISQHAQTNPGRSLALSAAQKNNQRLKNYHNSILYAFGMVG